jgi:hypothetical protein
MEGSRCLLKRDGLALTSLLPDFPVAEVPEHLRAVRSYSYEMGSRSPFPVRRGFAASLLSSNIMALRPIPS